MSGTGAGCQVPQALGVSLPTVGAPQWPSNVRLATVGEWLVWLKR